MEFTNKEKQRMSVRIAIVGTGGIARRHGEAIAAHPEAELIGAIDVDPAKAQTFAARYGGQAFATLADCLAGKAGAGAGAAVDAVYILTPPSFRRPYALEAIAANKHVFCEKPLAIAPEDGKAIVDAAERAGVVAITGFNQRYRLGYRRLKETVASGRIGTPYHFWSHRFGMGAGGTGQIQGTNWRTDPEMCCGMTVESLSHDIDLMRWILDDEVATVAGHVHSTVANLPNFDNNAQVLLTMRGGASAIINASWSSRIGVNARGVLGTTGTAFVSGSDVGNNGIWCSTAFHLKTDGDAHERVEMLHDNLDARSYQAETDDFIRAILTGATPLTSARDGYETLRVSQAILASSRMGEIIRL
jgi:myo-inositol 2-dehydrogenase/D-chiro-inositol 1-dehydrogenase